MSRGASGHRRANGGPTLSSRSETQRLVTPEQVERIHRETDLLGLSRDAVVVPLVVQPGPGFEKVLPDGKLLVQPPSAEFESWFKGFAGRLALTDLAKGPRAKSRTGR